MQLLLSDFACVRREGFGRMRVNAAWKVREETATCLLQFGASRWEVIFYSSCGGSSHLSPQMPNEYRSKPSCHLINTEAARGARPTPLPLTATTLHIPPWRSVLWAEQQQLAPHREESAALCQAL